MHSRTHTHASDTQWNVIWMNEYESKVKQLNNQTNEIKMDIETEETNFPLRSIDIFSHACICAMGVLVYVCAYTLQTCLPQTVDCKKSSDNDRSIGKENHSKAAHQKHSTSSEMKVYVIICKAQAHIHIHIHNWLASNRYDAMRRLRSVNWWAGLCVCVPHQINWTVTMNGLML